MAGARRQTRQNKKTTKLPVKPAPRALRVAASTTAAAVDAAFCAAARAAPMSFPYRRATRAERSPARTATAQPGGGRAAATWASAAWSPAPRGRVGQERPGRRVRRPRLRDVEVQGQAAHGRHRELLVLAARVDAERRRDGVLEGHVGRAALAVARVLGQGRHERPRGVRHDRSRVGEDPEAPGARLAQRRVGRRGRRDAGPRERLGQRPLAALDRLGREADGPGPELAVQGVLVRRRA